MAFRYQKRSYQDAKERINNSGGYDSYILPKFKLYKVKDGKNLIRILPPTWPKAKHYGYSIFINYGIGPDNASYLSLSKMLGKPDPLAEARIEANRAGDEELTRQLEARERVLIWVIDRDAEEEGPQVWPCPKTADADILSISTDDDTQELVEIDHPDEGQDLRFYREGKGLNTKYPAAKMRLMKPSPLNEDEKKQQQWLEYIEANPLPDCLRFYDYDYISKIYNGTSEETEKPRKARKPESEETEAEEPEEKPRRSARREEPEEAEAEEPEEKPRRSRREEPEDEPEAKPQRVTRQEPEDEEPEEKPRERTRARLKEPEPEDEEPEEKPAKKASKGSEDEMSIRDRLRKRRQASDDDEE